MLPLLSLAGKFPQEILAIQSSTLVELLDQGNNIFVKTFHFG